ncbi:MAG: hypothetical protein ACAI35_13560 [Candidatus Methylacidiphilales bacterium]|nr:hypothetical protein [Candidatus Methylacidiphilales bacterium]
MPSIDHFRGFSGSDRITADPQGEARVEKPKSGWEAFKALFTSAKPSEKTGFQRANCQFYDALKQRYGKEAAAVAFAPLVHGGHMEKSKPLTGRIIQSAIARAEQHAGLKKELGENVSKLRKQGAEFVTAGTVNRFMACTYLKFIPGDLRSKGMETLCRDVCGDALKTPSGKLVPKETRAKEMGKALLTVRDGMEKACNIGLDLKAKMPELAKVDVPAMMKQNGAEILRKAMSKGDGSPSFLRTPAGEEALRYAVAEVMAHKAAG